MNWVLIVVLLVLAGSILNGYRRGFLRLVYSLVSWILMFAVVSWATPYFSRFMFENTSVYDRVAAHCEEVIHQNAQEQVQKEAAGREEELAALGIRVPDRVMDDIFERVAGTADEFLEDSGIYTRLAAEVAVFITQGIAFLTALIIAWLIVHLISHLLGIVSRIPIIKGLNQFLGLFAGGIYGMMLIWIAFYIIAVCSAGETGQAVVSYIRASRILTFLYENNPVLFILIRYL